MSTTIATSALTAVAAGSLQSDDVLAILDVHDLSQAASGSLRKTTLVNLYRTETTPVTVSTPLPDIRQTWNAGGVVFTAVKLNITNTASAAGSLLLDLQVAAVSKWKVDKTGAVTQAGALTVSAGGIAVAAGDIVAPSSNVNAAGISTFDDLNNQIAIGRFSAGNPWAIITPQAVGASGVEIRDGSGNYVARFAVGRSTTLFGGLTVSSGGVTVTGNSTITGTLSGITTLTATSLGGTLTTASQPNVTGVGTLGALNVTGALNVGGITCSANLNLTGAGSNVRVTNGQLSVVAATAPDVGLSIGNSTAATATGGAAVLPAAPVGFLLWYIGAGVIKVPYYNT